MLYDLHVHTTASDGVETPEQVITKAAQIGLAGIAITDHDTVDGLEPALQFIQAHGKNIDFIPGIELNTDFGDDEVHILGYFIDYHDEHLINRLMEIRTQRYQRAEKMIDKLKEIGLSISFENVKKLAQGDLIGRPHIARALQQAGYVLSEEEAFRKYIDRGKPGYIPRYKFLPAEAIELVKQAGGISILAHPGLIKDSGKIGKIISMGVEGLEIFYPEHNSDQIMEFTRLARQHCLLITGGSDFHGGGSSESRNRLGFAGINTDMMEKIRAYYAYKNQNKIDKI
ncbi:MAG: phosphatase [Firmicutes bacterium HGW-Firmicutes-15]|nr:MAG: phosphatase [Firmicutes bacterium HGW-Firmicutes-15]